MIYNGQVDKQLKANDKWNLTVGYQTWGGKVKLATDDNYSYLTSEFKQRKPP